MHIMIRLTKQFRANKRKEMLGDMSSHFNAVQRHGGQRLKFMFHTLREHNLSLIDQDLSVNQIKFKACADFVRS